MSVSNNFSGLTDAQVADRRIKFGTNVLTPPAKDPWWRDFLLKFTGPLGKYCKGGKDGDPLIFILEIAGLLSIGISFYEYFGLHQDWKVFFEPIGIFVAILLATGLAAIFENKANKAFQILNQVNDDEPVEVLRNGTTTSIPRRDVVVDDIVVINTGDEIPADGDLLDAVTLNIDESSLTGEPMCSKTTDPDHFDKDATYPSNHVLRGTKVMEGHGMMRVTKVGDATEMGKVFTEAQIDNSVRTPLNIELDRLGALITTASEIIAALIVAGQLTVFMGAGNPAAYLPAIPTLAFLLMVMYKFKKWPMKYCVLATVGFVVAFFGFVIAAYSIINTGADSAQWADLIGHTLKTLMVAVTLIVVAVPEGLPMAITLSLAFSMRRMFKTNNLVRKMHACETMGATTVICTDKTGTLTQNLMQVAEANFYGDTNPKIIEEGIAVNSTATLDLSHDKPQALGNPTEGALLLWLHSRGIHISKLRDGARRISEVPFTTERKYMETTVESPVTGKLTRYVKGAPEIVLGLCEKVAGDVSRKQIEQQLRDFQDQAMRTLGFAYGIEDGPLTFLGIVAISDPVRADVPAAVAECRDAGIQIKIVTGDTPATAREIGRQIGLWTDADTDDNIITGPEFAALSDSELSRRVSDIKIISRARPTDKKRLVEALQKKGDIVAVTGDGTNDAPALHQAHVGLSMGDGTSVAKEASDITIIDNSFSSIGRAVMWGRSLYKNIQRFLLFQLTVNVAACLLVLVGSFMGTESPLTVTQMLWVNLIMDTFGAMALASLPPTPRVMKERPRDRNKSILSRAMTHEIAGVGIFFFLITIALYWLFNHAVVTSVPQMLHAVIGSAEEMTPYEATLLFSVFVWTHFWYMFNARTFDSGESVFRAGMSSGFWTIVGIIVIGQLFITEIAYEFFNVEPMLHTLDWKFNPSGTLDLLIIVAASSLVMWAREIWHALFSSSDTR